MKVYAIFLLIVILCLLLVRHSVTQVEQQNDYHPNIFVCIHSYRNKLCENVLNTLYENAKYKDNLTVCVIQHYDPRHDYDCTLDNHHKYKIHSERFHYNEPFSRHHAHHLSTKYIKHEDFFLSLSSSVHLVKDWDELLYNEWLKCKRSKAIVTSYIRPYTLKDDLRKSRYVPHILNAQVRREGDLPTQSFVYRLRKDIPQSTNSLSSGFAFVPMNAIKDVPFDPHIPLVKPMDGADLYWSARLWANGYRFYVPQCDIVYKHNKVHYKNILQSVFNKKCYEGVNRIKMQLGYQYDKFKANHDLASEYKIDTKKCKAFLQLHSQ